MTMSEYAQIIRIINNNTYEKLIYQEIEKLLQAKGYEIQDIRYSEYVQFRNRLDAMNRVPFMQAVLKEEKKPVPKKAQPKIDKETVLDIAKAIFRAAIIAAAGFIVPVIIPAVRGLEFPASFLAIVALLCGLLDYIPIPKNYDADYVNRRTKAREAARINIEAYLSQAYLHKDEIRMLCKHMNK